MLCCRGCFLTSSLVATLSLTLVTPFSIVYSIAMQHVSYIFVLMLVVVMLKVFSDICSACVLGLILLDTQL